MGVLKERIKCQPRHRARRPKVSLTQTQSKLGPRLTFDWLDPIHPFHRLDQIWISLFFKLETDPFEPYLDRLVGQTQKPDPKAQILNFKLMVLSTNNSMA